MNHRIALACSLAIALAAVAPSRADAADAADLSQAQQLDALQRRDRVFVVVVDKRYTAITLAKRLDGTVKIAETPQTVAFAHLAVQRDGAPPSRVDGLEEDLAREVATLITQQLGLSRASIAWLKRLLAMERVLPEELPQRADLEFVLRGKNVLYLLPKRDWEAAKPRFDSGDLVAIDEVDIGPALDSRIAPLQARVTAQTEARARTSDAVASLAKASDAWVGIVMPETAAKATPDKRVPRVTCRLTPADAAAQRLAAGYRYLPAFADAASVERDVGFDEAIEGVERLYEKLQTGKCAAAVVPQAQAAVIVAAMQREGFDFMLVEPRTAAQLAESYARAQADRSLQIPRIAQALHATVDEAAQAHAAGLTSPEVIAGVQETMRSTKYGVSGSIADVLQFRLDEQAAKRSGTTPLMVRDARNASEAAARQAAAAQRAAAASSATASVAGARDGSASSFTPLALAAAFLLRFAYGWAMRCPSCRKWFARRKEGAQLIGESSGYEYENQRDYHRDASGKDIGTTDRSVQVHVTRSTYLNHYVCKHCEHRWTDVSSYRTS